MRKNSVCFVEVGEDGDGQRIDNYLFKRLKGVPKSHIYRILRSGEVRVNKGRANAERRLQCGDRLRLPPLRLPHRDEAPPPPLRQFRVVHEDDALLVIDKPGDVAVHGGSGVSFGVIEQLRRARPQARFLELVHRLDRETSGLLLVAKKRSALTRLQQSFRLGAVDKRYLALVGGRWRDALRRIDQPLLRYVNAAGERRVRVDAAGDAARSVVRLKHRLAHAAGDFSLLEVQLLTGRTHQIRVHLAHSGFVIAGDDKYGDFSRNRELQRAGLKRMFLHAAALRLPHPVSDEPLALQSPLPPDLDSFLRAAGASVEVAPDVAL